MRSNLAKFDRAARSAAAVSFSSRFRFYVFMRWFGSAASLCEDCVTSGEITGQAYHACMAFVARRKAVRK
jgi:hypothetical protein